MGNPPATILYRRETHLDPEFLAILAIAEHVEGEGHAFRHGCAGLNYCPPLGVGAVEKARGSPHHLFLGVAGQAAETGIH